MNKFSRNRQWIIHPFIISVALWSEVNNAKPQSADRVTIVGEKESSPADKGRFRINWSISNVEYRQRALALTPLGTRYEDVKAFVFQEWRAEKRKPTEFVVHSETDLFKDLRSTGSRRILLEQAPRISIADPDHPYEAQADRNYMLATLIYKPDWWRPALAVTIIYVFDDKKKLIDLFVTHHSAAHNPLGDF